MKWGKTTEDRFAFRGGGYVRSAADAVFPAEQTEKKPGLKPWK